MSARKRVAAVLFQVIGLEYRLAGRVFSMGLRRLRDRMESTHRYSGAGEPCQVPAEDPPPSG